MFKILQNHLIIAPADNTQTSFGPLGHIRLDAKVLSLSEPWGLQTRVKLQPGVCFRGQEGMKGEAVGVGRNQRVETYCSNLKRS